MLCIAKMTYMEMIENGLWTGVSTIQESGFVFNTTCGIVEERDLKPIQVFSATTKIKGIGTVRWHIRGSSGTTTTLETTSYYIPEVDIRLFNLQVYFLENKASSFLMNS